MDVFYQHILPYLPVEFQNVILDPPSLSRPSTFLPVVRLILPYTKYLVVLLAFYIVWTTIVSIFGYVSRFMRFALRFGPILGFIAWVMANSGQGTMGELFEAVKQWTGISSATNTGQGMSPGIAALANLFGLDKSSNPPRSSRRKTTSKTRRASSQNDHSSSRHRNGAGQQDSNLFSSIFNGAEGVNQDNWQDIVQDFVKSSLAKASGLDWLFGDQETNHEERNQRRT